jgi:hypothetical protein
MRPNIPPMTLGAIVVLATLYENVENRQAVRELNASDSRRAGPRGKAATRRIQTRRSQSISRNT